jgi:hypothetical protein
MFTFANYGRKPLKTGEFKGYEKKYYNCTDKECTAHYYVLTNSSGMVKKYEHPHNHNPPAKPHPCKEVKEKAVVRLRAGDTPAAVHRDLTNNAPLPLSSAFAPTLSTVRNWQKHLSMEDMLTGDVFCNIKLKHPDFTRLSIQHPDIVVVLVSDFGAAVMAKTEEFFLDGTFNTMDASWFSPS